jgi:hypothetical protein
MSLEEKRGEYLRGKINELVTNSKNKNTRDLRKRINESKKGYQSRSNEVKDENGDLLADSHNILNMRKSYLYELLNAHVMWGRQKYIELSHLYAALS